MEDPVKLFSTGEIEYKLPNQESINKFIEEYKKLCEKHNIIVDTIWDNYVCMSRPDIGVKKTIDTHIQQLIKTTEFMKDVI